MATDEDVQRPRPTPRLVERLLDREHTYRVMQGTWARITASLGRVPLHYTDPEPDR